MYRYAGFDQSIPCGFRFLKWSATKHSPRFAYQWLDNVKINKYAKYDPNIPCGSRVMSFFPSDHRRTHIVLIVKTQWSCKIIVQTQGRARLTLIIVHTQGSCNMVQTKRSCINGKGYNYYVNWYRLVHDVMDHKIYP